MFFSRNLCLVRNSESCYLISVLFNGIVGPTKYWLGHFLYNQTHFNFFSLALKKIGTVGIWIPETFKNRTLWCPFFKLWDYSFSSNHLKTDQNEWQLFGPNCPVFKWLGYTYSPDHFKSEHSKLQQFVWFSNNRAVWFKNGILKLDHLVSKPLSTFWNPD